MPSDETPWVVKGVPQRIRHKVKVFAVQRGMTMAQAVEYLVDILIPDEKPAERPRVSWEADEVVMNALKASGDDPELQKALEDRIATERWRQGANPERHAAERAKVERELEQEDLNPAKRKWLENRVRRLREQEEFDRKILAAEPGSE